MDIRYLTVTDADFWLPRCTGDYALKLIGAPAYIKLVGGVMTIDSLYEPFVCEPPTEFIVRHKAPDGTFIEDNVSVTITNYPT